MQQIREPDIYEGDLGLIECYEVMRWRGIIPAATVRSVTEAQGKVPDPSPEKEGVEEVKETIFAAGCANKVSAPSSWSPLGLRAPVEGLIGAVNARRTAGWTGLSGVVGADACAMMSLRGTQMVQ